MELKRGRTDLIIETESAAETEFFWCAEHEGCNMIDAHGNIFILKSDGENNRHKTEKTNQNL